jgi:HK97 family phage prohead protease
MPMTILPAAEPEQRHARADEIRHELHEAGLAGWSPLRNVQVRDSSQTPDGSWIFEGHAAVFNVETVLLEFTDDLGTVRIREVIKPGAFTPALEAPDLLCHLNNGHDMTLVMASSDVQGIGGLRVTQDDYGLPYFAKVDPEVTYIRDAGILLRSGVIAGASFKFQIQKQTKTQVGDWDGDIDILYTIEEIYPLYDVCVCAQGAYRQATSGVRSRWLHGHTSPFRVDGGQPRRPLADERGASIVNADEAGDRGTTDWDAQLAAMRARVQVETPRKAGH